MVAKVHIRNVPDDQHQKIKTRAALAGMSISEYLLRETERSLAPAYPGGLLQRLRSHGKGNLSDSVVEAVAAEREGWLSYLTLRLLWRPCDSEQANSGALCSGGGLLIQPNRGPDQSKAAILLWCRPAIL
jgi:hypothetical protein